MKRPNILLVYADQMRGHDLRCAGNPDVITPHLDRLAAEGALFTNAVSNTPLCVPARGCLITGRHALSHRALTTGLPLPEDEVGIAELLQPLGYRTGYIGKWHLDGVPHERFTPPGKRRHGFDYWAAWNFAHAYFAGRYHRDTPEPIPIGGYEPDFQTELAIQFMEARRTEPFCLFVAWGPPHAPYEQVPERYKALYDPSRIGVRPNALQPRRQVIADSYAQITALDWNLGRLLAALARLGIAQDTIVVFTADHGDMLWSHGSLAKQQPWEESIRIPFIMRWPGHIPAGRRADTLVSLVDVASTLLGLAGTAIPASVQGVDLSQAVLGGGMAEPASAYISLPVRAPNTRELELRPGGEWRGVRTKRHTYARWRDGQGWLLFDNQQDPYQLHNLIDDPEARDVRAALECELRAWLVRTGDRFLTGEEHVQELGLGALWEQGVQYYADLERGRVMRGDRR